jgi:hypothetical protein
VPGAAVVAFDLGARVLFAQGAAVRCRGFDGALVGGQRLSDVVNDDAWAQLRGSWKAVLAGRASTFDVAAEVSVYSVRVLSWLSGSEVVGGIAVAQHVTDHRRLESVVSAQDVVARCGGSVDARVVNRGLLAFTTAAAGQRSWLAAAGARRLRPGVARTTTAP